MGYSPSNYHNNFYKPKLSLKTLLKIKDVLGLDLDKIDSQNVVSITKEQSFQYGGEPSCQQLLAAKDRIITELENRIKDKEFIIELLKNQK
jgi:hypothetical protein